MTTLSAPPTRSSREPVSAVLTRGASTAFTAAAVNAALALGLTAALDIDPDFAPLRLGSVLFDAISSVLIATVLLLVLRAVAGRFAHGVFVALVTVWTLITMALPLLLLTVTPAEEPGVSDAAVFATIPLYGVIGIASVVGLLRRS